MKAVQLRPMIVGLLAIDAAANATIATPIQLGEHHRHHNTRNRCDPREWSERRHRSLRNKRQCNGNVRVFSCQVRCSGRDGLDRRQPRRHVRQRSRGHGGEGRIEHRHRRLRRLPRVYLHGRQGHQRRERRLRHRCLRAGLWRSGIARRVHGAGCWALAASDGRLKRDIKDLRNASAIIGQLHPSLSRGTMLTAAPVLSPV
jgi:hypothetical protein